MTMSNFLPRCLRGRRKLSKERKWYVARRLDPPRSDEPFLSQATYTKIFLRFNTTFWSSSQYQLYADQDTRGYYPVWQSLDLPDFLPGSHVLFATVTGRESVRVERQSEAQTQAEMMTVLRAMYGPGIPEPEEMLFKSWHSDPLFRGTYSNWRTSHPPAVIDDLRAALEGRLWFAGEATSYKYYGFLQVSFPFLASSRITIN